jgi:hypothetical protein
MWEGAAAGCPSLGIYFMLKLGQLGPQVPCSHELK